MLSPNDVVITGLGLVTPLGIGREAFWAAIEAGQSGIDILPEFAGTELPFRFGARIKGFDAKQYVQPRKTIKVMCGEIQAGYSAAVLAMHDAGLEKGTVEPDRLGVVLGSEMLFGEVEEVAGVYRRCADNGQFKFSNWGGFVFKDLYPLWMLKYLPNMAACHISIAHDARGPNNSIVQGGASSLLAIGEAMMVLARGHADAMIAGGSGANVSFNSLPFRGWEQLSKWHGEPAGACRPFDAQRSGIVPGEGSAALVLETRQHAVGRGAKILACLAGFASRFEPLRNGQPAQGVAIGQSIEAALAAAGMTPADIGHVNAHGDSSIEQDRIEAQAIRRTLGDVPVTALKSYFGDLGSGSGAVELAASVLALASGRVPPTLNYETPDPDCPINVIHGGPLIAKSTALALNQSTTGQAAALVLTAP
ncbi:MAG: beta-ketoacyl-[acyl-carrier-protein] synthase family protein [Planctomycetaceae bacterium]|nr:beta-ketoacyl-[acyl-carrier-protein] synthase family protein [Planctomycetaceae bacterium]